MRIDEIDLIGDIKLKGLTAPSGKVISYSNSYGLTWSNAPTSQNISSSYIKTKGYNYIIVETVNTGDENADAITNGDRLVAAYAQAKLDIIGTLSVTNRFTIILMPGSYNLFNNSYLDLYTSFIDIIGLSSNPGSVYLYHSSTNQVFNYHQNVDSRLENVKMAGYLIPNGGVDTGQYLRWKNLIFTSDPFLSWIGINGEFENIKSISGFASNVASSLNGIYRNIECTGNSFTMINSGTPTLTGTFSNISISDTELAFWSLGSVSGTFENIKISPYVSGNLEAFLGSTLGSSTSVFKDIEIVSTNNITSLFYSSVGDISGTFKNISVKSLSVSNFMTSFTNILGTFDNINLNDTGSFFNSSGNIIGDFTNIKVGNVDNIFVDGTFGGEISGTFENIEVGIVGNKIFYTATLGGIFKNIEIKSGVGGSNSFYSNGSLSGTFQNINILDGTEFLKCLYSEGTMTATFKNININNASGDVLWSYLDMDLNCEDITITSSGTITSIFSSSTESIYGTYKNINLAGPFTNAFIAYLTLNINLKNLRYSNNSNNIFRAELGDIYGTYEDIFCDVGPGSVFNNSGDTSIHVKNMDIAGKNRLEIIGSAFLCLTGNLSGTFQNIRFGQLTTNCFCAGNVGIGGAAFWVDILVDDLVITKTYAPAFTPLTLFGATSYLKGTFSNIDVAVTPPGTFSSTNFSYIFRAGDDVTTGKNNVYCKNIRLGRVNPSPGTIDQGGIFYQGASVSNVYLENFVANTQVSPTVQLSGKIISSEIDQTIWSQRNLRVATGTIIEKSTILGSASNIGITGSHQSTYTIVSANTPGNIFGATPSGSTPPINYNILRTSPL